MSGVTASVSIHLSGRVVWADHESFTDDQICYENRSTGKWCYLPLTPENVDQAVVPLSDSIETFLTDLLNDRLEEQLDDLD